MIERIYILCLTIIITSEVWTITHCLGLGHETIVCTVCLSIFLCEALCIILKQQVNSNWSYSPETFDSGQKRRFDGWPWKTIGHLFCTISSFVHHFKASDEFKLELESWNAQLASRSAISCPVWPWNLTLKNNRAPLLCCFKFCASFRSHWWIQTGATVQKRPIGVKNDDFLAVWPWNLTDDLEIQQGLSPEQHQAFCIISLKKLTQTGVTVRKQLSWVLTSVTLIIDLRPWPFALVIFWGKFHDDTMRGTLWKRCHRQMDRWNWPFL